MNIRKIFSAICFVLFFLTISFPATAEDFTNALHAYLEQCVHAEIPGGCIVVGLVDARGSWIVSSGTLDNGTDQEADGNTIFPIDSMTGTFTYLVLQDMVTRGLMNPNDSAAKYLSPVVKMPTYNGKEITLLQLIRETSGLPDFSESLNPKRADNPLVDLTVEKMDAFVSSSQLTNDPGTRHYHGGVDKGLLAQAIELKAGTNFESLLIDRICSPLKMDSTRFTLTPKMKARLAIEHNKSGYTKPIFERGALQALGGLYSTANDLLNFVSALDLTPANLAPLKQDWSIYFPFTSHDGTIVYTAGGWFGSRSLLCYNKTHHRGMVVLSTSTDFKREWGDFILASEWKSDKRPAATNISGELYDSYLGQYQLSSGKSGSGVETNSPDTIGIRRAGNRLFVQGMGPDSISIDELLPPISVELLPQSKTRFFERLSSRLVNFSTGNRGEVTGLTINSPGRLFSFKKISNLPPPAPEPVKPRVAIQLAHPLLDAVVGDYEFPPSGQRVTGMKVTIRWEGNQLAGQAFGQNVLKGVFDIYPESETNFFLTLDGSQMIFVKNGEGRVTSVIHRSSHAGVPDSEGKRTLEPGFAPPP
ncbi:MAG TPA: serine hydrolase [Verrucomicrobiae bacterium]|jgi:CubicO group peptidase (beta-lactamase class C family)|nr:serine hydrolase [Verrucomicrobiae bacterium]